MWAKKIRVTWKKNQDFSFISQKYFKQSLHANTIGDGWKWKGGFSTFFHLTNCDLFMIHKTMTFKDDTLHAQACQGEANNKTQKIPTMAGCNPDRNWNTLKNNILNFCHECTVKLFHEVETGVQHETANPARP